jgi:phospholipase C
VPTTGEVFPGDKTHPSAPYGLGMRVPLMVVSPWSRGGWVNSQLFDHTSIIKFLEARFADEHSGLIETNIQPWRRAITGDLTTAFNFKSPNAGSSALPNVAQYMPTDKTAKPSMDLAVPSVQALPAQEPGVRYSRALPYQLHADGRLDTAAGAFAVAMSNTGRATAAFHVRSGNPADLPRCYTVEPGKQLDGVWQAAWAGQARYDLEVHGPNGFLRAFRGAPAGASRANVQVRARYEREGEDDVALVLTLENDSARPAHVTLTDQYSGHSRAMELRPGAAKHARWDVERTGRWYDVVITVRDDADFRVQLAGRIENGKDSISDPAMAR